MGKCLYSDHEGFCSLWCKEDKEIAECCDEDGCCSVEDDEDPLYSCGSFELPNGYE